MVYWACHPPSGTWSIWKDGELMKDGFPDSWTARDWSIANLQLDPIDFMAEWEKENTLADLKAETDFTDLPLFGG